LIDKWHPPGEPRWEPKCTVVIHRSRDEYREQVGPGSDQTSGSSLIRLAPGGVLHRRIDLLVDDDGGVSALQHELTHVVLADAFDGRKPPPWMDEGIATLEDPESKRELHRRDCREAIHDGVAFRVAELFSLEQLSHPNQVAVFYGQSLSLTRFLVERRDPKRLIAFVHDAQKLGYEHAVRSHYGFENVAELEHAWRKFETEGHKSREGHAGGQVPNRMPFKTVVGFD